MKRQEHFQTQADAHAQLAKDAGGLAEVFETMKKSASKEDAPVYEQGEKCAKGMSDAHQGLSAHFDSCLKSAEDEMTKLQPDSISSIFPSDVPSLSKVRMVPRNGQPGSEDLSKVPEQFRLLIANTEEG
jgi:hypothetical protein